MNHLIRTCLFCGIVISAQSDLTAQDCGTNPTPQQIEYLTQTRQARQAFDITQMAEDRYGASIHWIPVQFQECIPTSTSPKGLREASISTWMGQLNALFLPYRIQFYECSSFTTFVSSTLHYFDITEEPQLSAYDVPNVINVYAFGTVTSNGSSLGGYSYLPPSADRIILSKVGGNLFDSKVFLHEMGHYLGLYHTHGKTNNGTTDELVNGSNCLTAGDDVCDTPADPNLYTTSSSNCLYFGTARDLNNQAYLPDVRNHMSYAQKSCRNRFSVGQMNRMAYTATTDRNYLQGCAHPSGCDNPITQLPVVFDFENGLDGWINKAYEGYGAFVNIIPGTGAISPTTTGPEQAFSGNGYAHLDALHSGVNGASAIFISPCIDLRGQASPKVTFHYHAFGPEVDGVGAQVSIDGGHTFQGPAPHNALFYVTGDQGNGWHTVTCDLSAYKSAAALQIRLITGGGHLGDVAFDSIAIYNGPENACNLSLISEFLDISCHGNADGQIYLAPFGNFVAPVSYSWSNGASSNYVTGLSPGIYTVTATAANGCSVIATLPALSPNLLYAKTTQTNVLVYGQSTGSATAEALGGRYPYYYQWSNGATTASVSNLASGIYTVTVTDQNSCSSTKTLSITQPLITCSSYQTAFPWNSSIDLNLGIFQQVTGIDNFDWTRQSGATPTAQTGPDAAYNGSHYWYTKASGNNSPNKTALLKTSKCLTLTTITSPVFEFYYHLYGNQTGSLAVEISLDNELNWTTVWTLSGNQGNQWTKAMINLLPYKTDHTKIRIKGTTGPGSRGDMAIDALYIGEAGNNQYLPDSEVLIAPGMTVYPNPSAGLFELRMDEGLVCERAEIFNAAGQLIWEERTSSSLLNFDLSDQVSGCYYLRVQSGGEVQVLKLMLVR
ncbi:MAG: T9SS type A sorting domain-containing protein [Phycisphaerae bacterium]|nr:T9SS type A sorting domain-containing protein [Saprospiraceae bacterium]